MAIKPESREAVFRDLYFKYGGPEKMKIHIKSTGEEILVINGHCVTDRDSENPLFMRFLEKQNSKSAQLPTVTDNLTCLACKRTFSSSRKDAKYCSVRCRMKVQRCRDQERKRILAQELVNKAFKEPQ